MTDRLPAIKRRKIRDGWITQNQADWLIQEVERLRKETAELEEKLHIMCNVIERGDPRYAHNLKSALTNKETRP